MKRFKLLIENFLVYGIGSVISSIVPLVMLPIITRLMTDTYYYGIYDIFVIIVNFGSAFAVMGLYDAMFRLFFEKEDDKYKKEICSTAFSFVLISSLILFFVLNTFHEFFADLFFGNGKYGYLLMITAFTVLISSTNSIVSAPTRMQNKKLIFILFNTISPIIAYGISFPLLLKGYFVYALPLGTFVSALIIEISFFFINKEWFSLKYVRFSHLKELLKIGCPLMPNFLIYWIFNSADKLMIAKMLGESFTGIYAIGGKIGQVSQIIYMAFANGWQYFAFSTMKDNDQVDLVSKIFEYLGIISFSCGILLCCFNDLIFSILFVGDYVNGSIVAPYLFMAPLIQMLYQVAGNQFLVIKKTWITLFVLSIGAVSNIVLNVFGIKYIGIEGAALATLVGYTISTIICVIVLKKMKLINIRKKFIYSTILFISFFLVWRFISKSLLLVLPMSFIVIIIFVVLYKSDLESLIKNILIKNLNNKRVVNMGGILMEKRVDILLSVYKPNLAYLEKQLTSLNNQTYKNIKLYVFDDCVDFRCDVDVFKKYITNFPYEILPYQEKNLNYIGAFEELVKKSTGDYIAFCDQDDIWMEDKIEKSISYLNETNTLLVVSDKMLIDENDDVFCNSVRHSSNKNYDVWNTYDDICKYNLFTTYAVGMSIVMNGNFARKIVPFPKYTGHDRWVLSCASIEGKVGYYDQPLVKYRRHRKNVTGTLYGIETKQDYFEKRIIPDLKTIEALKQRYPEFKDIQEVESFALARKNGKIKDLFKYRYLAKDIAHFDLVVAFVPKFLFKYFVKLVRLIN